MKKQKEINPMADLAAQLFKGVRTQEEFKSIFVP